MGELVRINFRRRTIAGMLLPESLQDIEAAIDAVSTADTVTVDDVDANKLVYLAELCERYLELYDKFEDALIGEKVADDC